MKRAVIVARDNLYGLTADAQIVKIALEASGFAVTLETPRRSVFRRLIPAGRVSLAIHMERVFPAWRNAADRHFLIPNQERFPKRHIKRLAWIDRVLAKTRHAQAIFEALNVPTHYTGFQSPDRLLGEVAKDWGRFFHLAGGSTLKGTEDIVALWERHPEWPELVLIQKKENAPKSVPANVRLYSDYMDDMALRRLQNRCGIHLCPSRSEGWGHYILEAMSCACVTVTTDAPPMNEHVTSATGILIPHSEAAPRHLGTNYFVHTDALETAISRLVEMPKAQKENLGRAARLQYEQIASLFPKRLEEILTDEE